MQPSLFDPAYQVDAVLAFLETIMGYDPNLEASVTEVLWKT